MTEHPNTSMRLKYAEHLLSEVACGLRTPSWDQKTRAFIGWCRREDSGKKETCFCTHCHHAHHDSNINACGRPMIGEGYPYHDICLCGSRPSGEIKKIDLTIEVMQFMFRWIDEATDILRIVYMNKKQTPRSMKERINKAIGTHDSSMLSLLGGVKEINTKKKKGRSGN